MGTADRLVIMLHGFGSRGDSFLTPGNRWKALLPGAIIETPDAPYPFPMGTGFQWFSLAGITPENRPERIVAARNAFDHVIGGLIARNGFAERLDRVALVGFSQGSIMALDAVFSGRLPVGAVVGFSGRLASPEPSCASSRTPVLLIHGSADTVIASEESLAAAERLKALGVSAQANILPGVGHTISTKGETLAGEFIARQMD